MDGMYVFWVAHNSWDDLADLFLKFDDVDDDDNDYYSRGWWCSTFQVSREMIDETL